MPIYLYQCQSCGKAFDALRKISERDNSIPCTTCGSNTIRTVSSANIQSKDDSAHIVSHNPSVRNKAESSENNGIQISNCTIKGAHVGISLPEGANVKMSGNKFINVKTPIEFRKK